MLGSVLLSIGFGFFIAAFGLYHLMVFRVNRNVELGEQFPHSLAIGQRDELRTLYKSLYPRSIIYELTLTCSFSLILIAVAFVCFRVWSAVEGKLP
jgi:hypothetical protein